MTDSDRWLWLSAELPVELNTGRLVYSHRLVEGARRAGVDVTVVGTVATSHRDERPAYWRVVDEPLRGGWRSLVSRLPNLSYACSGPRLRQVVADELGRQWDAIVVDHLQMAWVVPQVPATARVVFVTHNHEAGVRRRVAAETPWGARKLALTLDARKARRLEAVALERADVVTTITEADRDAFAATDPDKRFVVLPPGWSGSRASSTVPMRDRPRRVGVMGSFDWHVKQENLRRFVVAAAGVFPARGIEFVVAGSMPDGFRDELVAAHPWVRVVGWVDDPADFLSDLRMGIVAEPLGGGFKLKSLDYVFGDVPVAALRGSLAGIPLVADESMIESATLDSLVVAIADRIDDPSKLQRLAESASDACAGRFEWQDRADQLVAAVASVSG